METLQEEDSYLPKLHSFPAKEVAKEMTLMDAGLLRMIKASELEDGAWMKKDKVDTVADYTAELLDWKLRTRSGD